MPELPEVESTARYLATRIVGATIVNATLLWQRTLAGVSMPEGLAALRGRTISAVGRRGKFVRIEFTSDPRDGTTPLLFFHLRMSGNLDVIEGRHALAPHDRLVLHLADGREVRFNDQRKFGRAYVVRDPDVVVGELGIEPLSEAFTVQVLQEILAVRGGAIKPLLLNQMFVCGLGNIYVDEALWYSRIHPRTPAVRLGPAQIRALYSAIRRVLMRAIDAQGTDFGDGVVTYGGYRPRVYGRDGERCARCGATIRRVVVGQRGTHICVKCQPTPKRRHARGSVATKGRTSAPVRIRAALQRSSRTATLAAAKSAKHKKNTKGRR